MSDAEKETIISIFKIIDAELKLPIDDFNQDVIISQVELLLNCSNRFYKRQFVTRKAAHSNLSQKLEELLDDHSNNEKIFNPGISDSSICIRKTKDLNKLSE